MSDGLKLLASTLENGSVATLRRLQADMFIENERAVYEFVKGHYRRYGNMPGFDTVLTETGVNLPQIEEQHDYYLRRVIDRKLFNEVSDQFALLRASMKQRNMDSVRANIGSMRRIVREQSADEDVRNLAEMGRSVVQDFQQAKENPGLAGVPSGWGGLDESTGGYQAGDLISMIARMGMGKTYLLLCQALHAWREGYNVLLVSMEMTLLQIGRRLAGMEAGINPEYIRKGQLSVWAERRLRHIMSGLQHADRFHLYAGGFSKKIDDVEVLIQEYDPDMVYIDGGYLLRPDTNRNMHRLERVAEVMDALKTMTIVHNRPIMQTSQFSRQAGKKGKEGSLETIGFTDAIGTHSSIVLGVKEGKTPHQNSRRVIEVMKGREGEHGDFWTQYQFSPISFDEIPKPVDENGNPIEDGATVESPNLDWMSQ